MCGMDCQLVIRCLSEYFRWIGAGRIVSHYDSIGKGVSKAGQGWSKYIEERSKLLVPHVRVLSGRYATAIFSESVKINGLFDQIEEVDVFPTYLD